MTIEGKFCSDCVYGKIIKRRPINFGRALGPIPTMLILPPRVERQCLNIFDYIKRVKANVPARAACEKPKLYRRRDL